MILLAFCITPKERHWLLWQPYSRFQECHQQRDLCNQIQQPELHHFPQKHLNKKGCDYFVILDLLNLIHSLMAESGCLASTPTSSATIPFAWEVPPKGLAFGPNRLSWTVCRATCAGHGASQQYEDSTLGHPAGATDLSKKAHGAFLRQSFKIFKFKDLCLFGVSFWWSF